MMKLRIQIDISGLNVVTDLGLCYNKTWVGPSLFICFFGDSLYHQTERFKPLFLIFTGQRCNLITKNDKV